MKRALVVAAVGACSGPAPKPTPTPPKPPTAAPAPDEADKPPPFEAACARMTELSATKCGNFGRMSLDPKTCPDMLEKMAVDAPGRKLVFCLADHADCDAVQACIKTPDPEPTPEAQASPDHVEDCAHHRPNAMVGIAHDDWLKRYGVGESKLSLLPTTVDHPLETCGFPAEADLLKSLRCDDGSAPVPDALTAERVRVGDAGKGGRCHSIIDHYRLPCPDKPYDVFVDAYLCSR